MRSLFQEMIRMLENQEGLVLVTVIADSGSTPRGAGARMIVRWDGSSLGTIGGGAVEYQAGKLALDVLKEKQSYTRGFKLAKNQVADLGMICGGNVVVYFQYISPDNRACINICYQVMEAFLRDEDSWIITEITDETAWTMGIYSRSLGLTGLEIADLKPLKSGKAVQASVGEHRYFSEPLVKAGRVYIFGGGHVAQELVPVISHLGFRCVVFDDREEFANKKLFPDADETVVGDFERISDYITITSGDYMAVMTRGHQFDYLIQRQALATPACYIGVMGSRQKLNTLAGKLLEEGFCSEDIDRFHGPIGTAILAETPAEIAISIAGELIMIRAKQGYSFA